jgi:hypothetical protein
METSPLRLAAAMRAGPPLVTVLLDRVVGAGVVAFCATVFVMPPENSFIVWFRKQSLHRKRKR